jgi:hypothetical protein
MEASQASLRQLVGSICTLILFPGGFVNSSKWFHSCIFPADPRTSRPGPPGEIWVAKFANLGWRLAAGPEFSTRNGAGKGVKIACLAPLGALR